MIFTGTFLKPGQRFDITNGAYIKVFEQFENKRISLILGHQVEFSHDDLLAAYGIPFEKSKPYAVYDRKIRSQPYIEDDKVATFETKNKRLSQTHNITDREFDAWVKEVHAGRDVIIRSFQYVSSAYNEVIYNGAISFRLLLAAPEGMGMKPFVGNADEPTSRSFHWPSALRHNPYEGYT